MFPARFFGFLFEELVLKWGQYKMLGLEEPSILDKKLTYD